jgi:NAD-dependent SIR2 family protein deacetylase
MPIKEIQVYTNECTECEWTFYTEREFIPPNYPKCNICGNLHTTRAIPGYVVLKKISK